MLTDGPSLKLVNIRIPVVASDDSFASSSESLVSRHQNSLNRFTGAFPKRFMVSKGTLVWD